ncbi:PREDICTED: uncharacterized protein LOC107339006 [Acropora digitifera]|uniref:uncharacterized protein LOC107339006 n=1 Tax=Acropora digitifera TaxID=70779 RepID=UPI00077A3AB5|nr:PREDICTED: uncharacterized protein LOC107339006 [Acropora digitifera]
MSSGSFLEEKDIPGASLCGRKPSELENVELKFWLRCRGDPDKGFKTKAKLVKRVEEYIKTGKDKNIVDPDPNGLYTKRKQQCNALGSELHRVLRMVMRTTKNALLSSIPPMDGVRLWKRCLCSLGQKCLCEVRNFTPIFVKITILCALRHTAARRHCSSSKSSFSDKIPL